MGVTELTLVRHGESMGNVAAAAAEAAGLEVIDVPLRDPDVPLSPDGRDQAHALGVGLSKLAEGARPQVVWASPHRRAVETAEIALQTAGLALPIRVDDRLRDRELGVLDLLTMKGVEARFPQEAARRRWLGKFYHRPPGGESWADVALRLRGVLTDLDTLADGQRVLVVSHDAVVMLFRYLCEGLTELQMLEITRASWVRNASVTRLVRPPGEPWAVDVFNDVRHLELTDAEVTTHPGDPHVLPQ